MAENWMDRIDSILAKMDSTEEFQSKLARFHREIIALARSARSIFRIAYTPAFQFIWMEGDLKLADVLGVLRPNVSVRVVLGLIGELENEPSPEDVADIEQIARGFMDTVPDCQVRVGHEWSGPHYMIADSTYALAVRHGPFIDGSPIRQRPQLSSYRTVKDIEDHTRLFHGMWLNSLPLSRIYDFCFTELESPNAFSVSVLRRDWAAIARRISGNPNLLRSLGSRDFEELVAHLLEREGYQTQITPRTNDKGRDILAAIDSPIGRHLFLVECKHFAPDRPVGVELVRSLYGVIESERATAGLLITSSVFTSGAMDLQRSLCHRLHLKDYYALLRMLKEHPS